MENNAVRHGPAANPLQISVIITAYNEGDELLRTISSIRASTPEVCEILVVDDGSTDGSCDAAAAISTVRLIRHSSRIGVAHSRDEASRQAIGNVIAYFDGHQRVEGDALSRCGEVALYHRAIACPDLCGLDDDFRIHGAYFVQCRKRKYFSAEWKQRTPQGSVGPISSLKAPTYLLPTSLYPSVAWSSALRGWGGSEAAISLKAFFTGIPILHVCGPLMRHQFKPKFHYSVGWDEIWRNQAIIARICFDDRSWYQYWLPAVFESNLNDSTKRELESELIKSEQQQFAAIKVRPDHDFWTRLIFQELPHSLNG